jgi:DNA-binding winged helix-turn-helix (wHTH) protein
VQGAVYRFGEFSLDAGRRRLTRAGQPVNVADRHLSVLLRLVAHPGQVVSKDDLVQAAWQDVAVTDNSLEHAISALRRALGAPPAGEPYIETVPRQGYRFARPVTRSAARVSDAALESLIAPHRAWIEGRAALETLEREGVLRARRAFEEVLLVMPDQAAAHVGVANACVMQFETTRADPQPDNAALVLAARHAREACRLEPGLGEAWATLGFVLDRAGDRTDAAAASRRAVALEPDNWRHHLRLGYVSWGEERLRSAQRTLALLPAFPLAHWLAATVHVARQALDSAERELLSGAAALQGASAHQRFSAVAVHWLLGLVQLARGDERAALKSFEAELALESRGHLYARECCANTWYAIGALHLCRKFSSDACAAFEQAIARVPSHPTSRAALGALRGAASERADSALAPDARSSMDAAFARAIALALAGSHVEAAKTVEEALSRAPVGTSAGWFLPVEPLLQVRARPDIWARALRRLSATAA